MNFIAGIFLTIFLTASLAENIPPSIVEWKSKKQVYLRRDATYALKCVGNGTGNLEIEWRKDGGVIREQSSIEQIKSLPKGHVGQNLKFDLFDSQNEGFYQCRIRNTFGTALSDVSWLRKAVETYPTPTEPIEKSVKVGNSLVLGCPEKMLFSPPALVRWVKSDRDDSTKTSLIVYDKRVLMDENGSLTFSYVYKKDEWTDSIYRCQLHSALDSLASFPGSSYSVTVDDLSPAAPTTLEKLFTYVTPRIALVGKNVTMGCFFAGADDVDISWENSQGHQPTGTKPGDVDISPSTITLKNLRKDQQGKYFCTGRSSSKGFIKREELELVIQEEPAFLSKPTDKTINEKSTAEFRCITSANPAATVNWFMNGESIDKILPERMSLNGDRTILTVKDVCKQNCRSGKGDLMVIQCNSSNVHGYVFGNGYLNVLKKTEITEKPEDVEYNPKKNVTFRCFATTDEETRIAYRWLFNDEYTQDGSVNKTAQILFIDLPNLPDQGKNYVGKWTCEATNGYSVDSQSAYLKITPAPAYVWPYWWVVLLVLLLFLLVLLIILCVCCYLYQNRGDQYPVDEIEHKNGNDPEKELEAAGFHDFQRDALLPRTDSASGTLSSQDRTLIKQKKSQGSLSGSLGRTSTEDLSGGRFNTGQYNS